ncbi:hypothetical protein ACLBWT_08155 [Paenibacillus sp. D51F]
MTEAEAAIAALEAQAAADQAAANAVKAQISALPSKEAVTLADKAAAAQARTAYDALSATQKALVGDFLETTSSDRGPYGPMRECFVIISSLFLRKNLLLLFK